VDLAPSDMVNSVAWSQRGTYLSVGTSHGDTLIFDISKLKQIRTMQGHRARVGTMAWNSHLLSTGSRDKIVLQRDVRVPDAFVQKFAPLPCSPCCSRVLPVLHVTPAALAVSLLSACCTTPPFRSASCFQRLAALKTWIHNSHANVWGVVFASKVFCERGTPMCRCTAHRSEVCGLKWSPDNRQLASGGNDNQLCIWDLNSSTPAMKFAEHTAAVKAIAWSPHQHGLLASGGGTADRCIRFWNTATNSKLNTIDTGSQVGLLLMLHVHVRTVMGTCLSSHWSLITLVSHHTARRVSSCCASCV
jgi:WD40 repeat protein